MVIGARGLPEERFVFEARAADMHGLWLAPRLTSALPRFLLAAQLCRARTRSWKMALVHSWES